MSKWKTDKWYTSQLNFVEEVCNEMHFKDNIKIHDVTLRDGEQQAGIVLTTDQKIMLAEKMSEVGIHRIEAGMPAVSPDDAKAMKTIANLGLNSEIFGFARCMVDDVKRVQDTGATGLVIEIPSNEELIREAYGWSLEKAIELSVESTKAAKEAGLYTVFFPIDMTRANLNWVLELIQQVAENGHMDALAIVDTIGGIAPHTVPYLVKMVRSRINKPIEIHFHDDFHLGVANSIMALASGADVVHTTISSCGERAGNTGYEALVMALLTMYDCNLGLDYSKIYGLSKMLREYVNLPIRDNMGIIGDRIFDIESGIVAGWYANVMHKEPLLTSPYLPELIGHRPSNVVLGKHSGLPSLDYWAEKMGVNIDPERVQELLKTVKERSITKKSTLDQEEISELFAQFS